MTLAATRTNASSDVDHFMLIHLNDNSSNSDTDTSSLESSNKRARLYYDTACRMQKQEHKTSMTDV